MKIGLYLAERRLLPDAIIRAGIRKLLQARLSEIETSGLSAADWIGRVQDRPIAESTDAANEQHYEIPAPYFQTALGPHLKYSSGFWPSPLTDLAASEAAMLQRSCERADLQDGQRILELGCGWGSLSLWMAAHYPNSHITAVSNSHSQRSFILAQAQQRGLENLNVITSDINDFTPEENQFDRVVSVEMFEHVRNHQRLFERIHNWLKPAGKIFIHIFAHKQYSYLFESRDSRDWMARYFFTGGVMPAADLLPAAAKPHFELESSWQVNGRHYSRTLEAWLEKQDANEATVLQQLQPVYGKSTHTWVQRWRIFYMACSELFGYNQGEEWFVMHYRLAKKDCA
jgi:cyclopropane-fatty-acyl-phospholipid synthase